MSQNVLQAQLHALYAQLRRMRAMDYRYHALFFRYINFWITVIVALLVASLLAPLRAAVLRFPPLIVYAAMQSAYHLHYINFARHFARALEERLNAMTGGDALIAHELEERYLYPLDAARLVGVSVANPLSFFSAMTLHYGIAGTLLLLFALYRAAQILPGLATPFPPLGLYVPVMGLWIAANTLYMFWYFVARRDERRLEERLTSFAAEGNS